MLAPRIVRALVVLIALAPVAGHVAMSRARPSVSGCVPEGRGAAPRHWVGCAEDGGPRRELTGAERLSFEMPLDLNRATAEDLRLVPGLSSKLADAVVADRLARGPFAEVEDLERVRGIGPARMEKARRHLAVGPAAARRQAGRDAGRASVDGEADGDGGADPR